MLIPFARLLCTAALAGAALAQSISVATPHAGTSVLGGTAITVQLEKPAATTDIQELSLVIAAISCLGGCSGDITNLGTVLYTGTFNPQSTKSAGNQYENFTVAVPNWFDGPGAINVARFYLSGVYKAPKLELVTSAINVYGNQG